MPRLAVFHTSDLHNRLTAEAAARLRELKESEPGSLMLDSGDAIRAGNVFWLPREPVLELMNSVPYDAMCMGNREYHLLRAGIAAKTSQARFPILSANLRTTQPGHPMPARPYVVFERAGLKVGVAGLTVPCVTERMLVRRMASFYFEDPLAAARAVIPELAGKCDLVILLAHLPFGTDEKIAADVPGIHLILSGHSHKLDAPQAAGGTTILRHGAYGRHVGKAVIELEGSRLSITDETIPLNTAAGAPERVSP